MTNRKIYKEFFVSIYMSYIDFESEGIEYRLILSRHHSKRKEPIDGLDALVVESGFIDQKDYADYLTKDSELANYLEEIAERDIPIYSVDNKGRNTSLCITEIIGHLFSLPLITYGISKLVGADDDTARNIALGTLSGEVSILIAPSFLNNGISKFLAKANSALSLITQSPSIELRNALTARKIKNGVVPHLMEKYPERFNGRNPKIGIIYGAGHSGIKECLESDSRTDFSLNIHKNYGLRFILDRNTLKDFHEYRLDSNKNVSYQKFQVESLSPKHTLNPRISQNSYNSIP